MPQTKINENLLTTNCNIKRMFVGADGTYERGQVVTGARYHVRNGRQTRTVVVLEKIEIADNAVDQIVAIVSGDVQKAGIKSSDLTDANINALSEFEIYVV